MKSTRRCEPLALASGITLSPEANHSSEKKDTLNAKKKYNFHLTLFICNCGPASQGAHRPETTLALVKRAVEKGWAGYKSRCGGGGGLWLRCRAARDTTGAAGCRDCCVAASCGDGDGHRRRGSRGALGGFRDGHLFSESRSTAGHALRGRRALLVGRKGCREWG